MNLVDSCGWLEYLADGPNSGLFGPAIENFPGLIVPTICLYEVVRKLSPSVDKETTLRTIAYMRRGRVIDLDQELALAASRLSIQHRLPMADSIILATAGRWKARIWTQDEDFKGIPNIRYIQRK